MRHVVSAGRAIVEQEGTRFVKIGLENETVRAESGALSTMSGDIVMDVPLPSVGRLLKSYLSVEAYLRRLHGHRRRPARAVLKWPLRLRPAGGELDPGQWHLLGVRGVGGGEYQQRAGLDLVLGR